MAMEQTSRFPGVGLRFAVHSKLNDTPLHLVLPLEEVGKPVPDDLGGLEDS